MRLVLDNLQAEQAKKELKGAEDLLPRVARECYKWLLCPSQDSPTATKPTVEVFPLTTSGAALGPEIERVCLDNELVIATWSPIHLRTKLKELYWKADKPAVKAADFWEDTLRYLYLPRLKDRGVLAQAVVKGAGTRDFFGTAYGQSGDTYDGFKFGDSNVQFDDTLLLIDPETAKAYEKAHPPSSPSPVPQGPTPLGPTLPSPTPSGFNTKKQNVLRISRCSSRDCKSSVRSNRRRSHRGVRQRSQRDSKSDRRNIVRLSRGCVGSDQACCFGKR